MTLTLAAITAAKPREKDYKIYDASGLFMLVHRSGSKYWRYKYRYNNKEKVLALGVYPEINLQEARERCGEARKVLAGGQDPFQAKMEKKLQIFTKSANNFEFIAREWHENKLSTWSDRAGNAILVRLEADIFPWVGKRPINEINAPELLNCLKKVEARGALQVAHRILQYCNHIFDYAIASGRADRNIAAGLKKALKPPVQGNFSHLSAQDLPKFLSILKEKNINLTTKCAIWFLIYTLSRSVEVRGARWAEIDFIKQEWKIPAARMKMEKDHTVMLSKQAIDILKCMQSISGNYEYIFPAQKRPRDPMSSCTMLYALYKMGYHNKATMHGFRHTASTILNEKGFRPDIIETALAHSDKNRVRGTYNHAEYKEERLVMMQLWSNYLEKLV